MPREVLAYILISLRTKVKRKIKLHTLIKNLFTHSTEKSRALGFRPCKPKESEQFQNEVIIYVHRYLQAKAVDLQPFSNIYEFYSRYS